MLGSNPSALRFRARDVVRRRIREPQIVGAVVNFRSFFAPEIKAINP